MTFKNKSLQLIEHYQKNLSHRKPKQCKCRFNPSCSEYTRQAIVKYGGIRGWALGIWRILRCNPFTKGGYDPIK